MARRFIAGATPAEALATVLELRRRRIAFTADLLGEAVISEHEAEIYQQTCLDVLRGLAGPLAARPEIPQIDRDEHGPIPRVNLSLKPTSLSARFDSLYADATLRRLAARLRPILRTAREVGAYVHVDMEQFAHMDLTFAIFRSVLSKPEFRDWTDVGTVVQAYLRDTDVRTNQTGGAYFGREYALDKDHLIFPIGVWLVRTDLLGKELAPASATITDRLLWGLRAHPSATLDKMRTEL